MSTTSEPISVASASRKTYLLGSRPLCRCRRLLTKADERLDDTGRSKLLGLLEAGDPHGEVRMAWHDKKSSARSTHTPILSSLTRSWHASATISKTSRVRLRSTGSDGHCCAGASRS